MREHTTSSTGCRGEERKRVEGGKRERWAGVERERESTVKHTALYNILLHSHPTLSTDEVQLVHYEEADTLNVLPLLPPPRQHVPVLWSTDDDVALLPRRVNHEGWRVRGE